MLKQQWRENGMVQNYYTRNMVGPNPTNAPLLVLGGESDPLINSEDCYPVVPDKVQFRKYPESDPGRVIGGDPGATRMDLGKTCEQASTNQLLTIAKECGDYCLRATSVPSITGRYKTEAYRSRLASAGEADRATLTT